MMTNTKRTAKNRIKVNKAYMETRFGKLILEEDGSGICGVNFCREGEPLDIEICETALLKEAKKQLEEYFQGIRRVFDLPLSLSGTPFQQKDWEALLEIPYGETRSYKDIAERIGSPKGFRAVGMANHNNPVSIIVPCHRVIGSDGSMVGYGGGLDIKAYLLNFEREQVNLDRESSQNTEI